VDPQLGNIAWRHKNKKPYFTEATASDWILGWWLSYRLAAIGQAQKPGVIAVARNSFHLGVSKSPYTRCQKFFPPPLTLRKTFQEQVNRINLPLIK